MSGPSEIAAIHTVAVLALNGVVPFDLAIPVEVFGRVRLPNPAQEYRVRVCAETAEVRARSFGIRAPWTLAELALADTVIVPGIDDLEAPVPDTIVTAIRSAYANGARVVSICSGALVLAATGLLDGRRATTHWLAAALLARRSPAVTVDPDVLFVDEGRIVTRRCWRRLRCRSVRSPRRRASRARRLFATASARRSGSARRCTGARWVFRQCRLSKPALDLGSAEA